MEASEGFINRSQVLRSRHHVFLFVILSSCVTDNLTLKGSTESMSAHQEEFSSVSLGVGKQELVFIHGIGSSKETWNSITPFFDTEKYTIHCLDLLGHGSPYSPGDQLTPAYQAGFVARFLQSKGIENPIVVGHSYGGIVSIILRLNQDDFNVRIKQIIFINSPIFPSEYPLFVKYYREDWLSSVVNFFTTPRFRVNFSLRHIFVDDEKISQAITDIYVLNATDKVRVSGIKNTAKNIIVEELSTYMEHYASVFDPVMLIRTNQDVVTPKRIVTQFQNSFPNSRVVELDGCGHNAQEECPEKIAKVILQEVER